MFNKNKLSDARKLLRSKTYIFINDMDASFFGNFKGIELFSVLHSLFQVRDNLDGVMKDLKAKYEREDKPSKKRSSK